MTHKHTPGPWSAHIGDSGLETYVSMPDWTEFYIGSEDQDIDTIEANAHLIAAAPELLGALDMLYERYGGITMHEVEREQVLTALKKARGETK